MDNEGASKPKHATREQWLAAAVEDFKPWFKKQGKPLPTKLRVSCGWPLGSRKFIGECWSGAASADGAREIFVSPQLDDVAVALSTLLHECVHAALPFYDENKKRVGHRKPFAQLAKALGLVKPWKATTASPELAKTLAGVARGLGKYPHAKLDPGMDRKKQATRLLKCSCATCGYVVRVTRKWLDEVGFPHCPNHGEMQEGG